MEGSCLAAMVSDLCRSGTDVTGTGYRPVSISQLNADRPMREEGLTRMGLEIESRPSDSPYIERVWRSSSSEVNRMTFGIIFSLGTSLSHLPVNRLVDGSAEIPDATRRSFWLNGSAWRLPDYDNAEGFVRRMVGEGVLVCDPVVTAALRGAPADVSERTVQRRFVAATGLTRGAITQIGRARQAAVLIQEGMPAHDVAYRLGYFDQPHLARSLTRYIGRTATQLRDRDPSEPLSLLYKT